MIFVYHIIRINIQTNNYILTFQINLDLVFSKLKIGSNINEGKMHQKELLNFLQRNNSVKKSMLFYKSILSKTKSLH